MATYPQKPAKLGIKRKKKRYIYVQKRTSSDENLLFTQIDDLPMKKGKVLLVEDNKMNQLLIQKIFSQMDCGLSIANHGKEALVMVKTDQYDLILMDIQMPEMDGFEASSQIRKQGINTPILALTASLFDDVANKAKEMGMNGFLTKPLDILELQETMSQYLAV